MSLILQDSSDPGREPPRYDRAIRLVVAIGIAAASLFGRPSRVEAMDASGPWPALRIFYQVEPSFDQAGFLRDSLYAGEQAWKIQGLAQQGEFWNDDNYNSTYRRIVYAGPYDYWGPAIAAVQQIPCRDNGVACQMIFEYQYGQRWNTTREIRNSDWLDFIGVAAHEFGHWLGCRHSFESPSTDPNYPTMYYTATPQGEPAEAWARTIQADDVNCLRAARPITATNMAANGSFEYAPTPGWGGLGQMGWLYKPSPAGGSGTRYCPGSVNGSCFVQFNGGGSASSSMLQDIGLWNGSWLATRPMHFRAYVRSPVINTTATVAVWALDPSPVLIASSTCVLAAGQWLNCPTPTFTKPTSTLYLRIEIYNNAYHNLDVDHARLVF